MVISRRILAAGVMVLALAFAPARAEKPEGPPEHVQALIEQLGDPEFRTREAAEATLREIGPVATEALEAAASHPSPEVRNRAKRIIEDIFNPPPARRDEIRQQAQAALTRGDLDLVLRYQEHLARLREPDEADLVWLGHAHRLLEQWPEAVAAYAEALARMNERGREAAPGEAAARGMASIEAVALRMGCIQRDVLEDYPAAAASFASIIEQEPRLNRQVEELLAEWTRRGAEPPRRTQPLRPHTLTALRELAITQRRMGRHAEAIDAFNRFNLLQLLHYPDASWSEVAAVARLLRQWPAEEALPELAGLTVLTPGAPQASFQVSESALPEAAAHIYQSIGTAEYRRRGFAFVPPPGREFATLELTVTATRGRRWSEKTLALEAIAAVEGDQVIALGAVTWKRSDPDEPLSRTLRAQVPAGIAMVRFETQWEEQGFMAEVFTLRATFRDARPWVVPPAPPWGVEGGPFIAAATDLRLERPAGHTSANLARLADGRWLLAYLDAEGSIHCSTSADGKGWSAPQVPSFARYDAAGALALCADDDGAVWLAFRADRLGIPQTRVQPPILWLTHTRDGRTWDPPRPLQAPEQRGDDVVQLLRGPDGRCYVVYLDQVGHAGDFASITGLTSLGIRQKFGHDVDGVHLSLDDAGRYHLVFRGARRSLYHARSADLRDWSEPLQVVDGPSNDYPHRPQFLISGNDAALLYETQSDEALLRRITFAQRVTVSRPVKVAAPPAHLAGSRWHIAPDDHVTLPVGADVLWLLGAARDELVKP